MQFKLKKELISGRYFVRIELTEFNDQDKAKIAKFGVPIILLKSKIGNNVPAMVNQLLAYEPFGFYNQEEADQYASNLKSQIADLRQKWDTLEDTWSNEEVL
jgi:hypothetical protein